MRYFEAHNCTRTIAGQKFEPYDIVAGTWVGVFATKDPELMDSLSAIASSAASAVYEISEAEYAAALKKKAPRLMNYVHSNGQSTVQTLSLDVRAGTPLKGNGRALVVEEPEDKVTEQENSGVENLEDVLAVENIGEPKSKKTKTK